MNRWENHKLNNIFPGVHNFRSNTAQQEAKKNDLTSTLKDNPLEISKRKD